MIPSSITETQWNSAVVETIDALKAKPGALLPILHDIQSQLGYVPTESIDLIAQALNQSTAEIYGVISFYHQFRTTPRGAHQVEICRAESCQSMGGRDLEMHAKASLGIDYHQTTADGEITLEPVYCLGNCACSPSIRIDDETYARVSSQQFDELVASLKTQSLEVKNG
jgi:formate dehydrogenase subunit gamma